MTCQYTLLPQRGVLQVSGADARVFLQGLLTNNLERLTPGQALYAALLTPPGRFLFDMLLVERQDGALLLEAEGERLPELITTLQRWKLRARVEITDVSADWQAVVIFGAEALPGLELPATPGALRPWGEAAAGYVYVDPRLAALGARALLPAATAEGALAAAGCTAAEFAAYDRHRIQLAVPDGSRDMPVDKAIILEYGLDRLNGIDFYKGSTLR